MSSSRYAIVAKIEAMDRPVAADAIVPLLDSQTRINEAIENLLCHDDLQSLEQADKLLSDAFYRITKARGVVHELRRAVRGETTIAETG